MPKIFGKTFPLGDFFRALEKKLIGKNTHKIQ